MNRENAWTTYEEADIKALEGLCKEYKDFLSNGKTERELSLIHISEPTRH